MIGAPDASSISHAASVIMGAVALTTTDDGAAVEYWTKSHDFLLKLDIPSYSRLATVSTVALNDSLRACRSIYELLSLIFRPLLRLCWFGCQRLVDLGIWNKFYNYQRHLTRQQLFAELSVLLSFLILYNLRRHLHQQQYVLRLQSWCQRSRLSAIKIYRGWCDRISQTSIVLAMILPHALFVLFVLALKFLFPDTIQCLATETYLTFILSTAYPCYATVLLISEQRRQIQQRQRDNDADAEVGTATSKRNVVSSLREKVQYWINYWIVHTTVSGITEMFYLLPFLGRILTKTIFLHNRLLELELAFYVWICILPRALTSPSLSLERTYDVSPLNVLVQRIWPVLLRFYQSISHAVPEPIWKAMTDRAKTVLQLGVVMGMLSVPTKDVLVAVLQHSHPFVIPGLTLLMPGFVTAYGVLYVKTVVPTAKALMQPDTRVQQLEYFCVAALLMLTLRYLFDGVLWWIPFSTHALFVLWCYLQIASNRWYNAMERSLWKRLSTNNSLPERSKEPMKLT